MTEISNSGALVETIHAMEQEIERLRALLREAVDWYKNRPRSGWLDDTMRAVHEGKEAAGE